MRASKLVNFATMTDVSGTAVSKPGGVIVSELDKGLERLTHIHIPFS